MTRCVFPHLEGSGSREEVRSASSGNGRQPFQYQVRMKCPCSQHCLLTVQRMIPLSLKRECEVKAKDHISQKSDLSVKRLVIVSLIVSSLTCVLYSWCLLTAFAARRCWQCGESLLGKIPFQYLDFSFCTSRCVQAHRKAGAASAKNTT